MAGSRDAAWSPVEGVASCPSGALGGPSFPERGTRLRPRPRKGGAEAELGTSTRQPHTGAFPGTLGCEGTRWNFLPRAGKGRKVGGCRYPRPVMKQGCAAPPAHAGTVTCARPLTVPALRVAPVSLECSLDGAHCCDGPEGGWPPHLAPEASAHALHMAGDPVEGDVQGRGHCFLEKGRCVRGRSFLSLETALPAENGGGHRAS